LIGRVNHTGHAVRCFLSL